MAPKKKSDDMDVVTANKNLTSKCNLKSFSNL